MITSVMNINYFFRISLPGSFAGKWQWSRMVGKTTKERDKDNEKVDISILCWSSCTQRQHQMMPITYHVLPISYYFS